MHPWIHAANGVLRKIPVWPGYVLGFLPAVWLFWQAMQGNLGANPVKALEHEYGKIALQLLIASLLVTPILQLTRLNLIRYRRMIGLMAFYYVLMHFAVYLFLDLQLNWAQVVKDVTKRPYIIVGTLALLMLIPVALSSNDWSVRKLGAGAWCKIHKLVYPASILAAVHYIWLVKSWPLEPVLYLVGMVLLVGWRPYRKMRQARTRAMA
ncbi:MAG: protein-methionine-sulfoxide reductase heme-binding subunit MsrQ [Pseudomonadota bacterium]